ncbi:uncharacterized protein ACRADG_009387 [Cochliomyia hominivorax]
MQSYGYLNNNNTILTTAINANNNNNNNNASNNKHATMNPLSAGPATTQSILINALAGGGSILERGDYMQCKHCKRFYKSAQKLQEHVRKYCLKEKKYKCVSCEYRSRRKDHVLRHARRKHSELYERYREDEENLFVVRNVEEGSYEADIDYDGPNEDYLIPAVSMGIGSSAGVSLDGLGGGGGGGIGSGVSSGGVVPDNVASTMQAMGLQFGSRDLVITAVPVLQESEEDDDDYDEDGE